MNDLAGRVAVVTGAASGIGLALAEAFAARGMKVVLADVEQVALEQAADRVRERTTDVAAIRTDVMSAAEVEQLAEETVATFGRVDVVCNNAGVNGDLGERMWELDLKEWEWILGVNLWGVIHGIKAFVPRLVVQGSGHIVNTASMAGVTTMRMFAPYTASKHAVVALSETLRLQLRDAGSDVGVSILLPGMVPTGIRESNRNRPHHLRSEDEPVPTGRPDPDVLPAPSDGEVVTAADVAERTLHAIEHDLLYVPTHRGAIARVRERLEAVTTGFSILDDD